MKFRTIGYFFSCLFSFFFMILFFRNHFPAEYHFQFHSIIEAIGGAAALFLAFLLYQQAGKRSRRYTYWVQGGLIGMGMLDLFHSMAPPGDGFVWLRSSATLVGGLCFALVWLPGKVQQTKMFSMLPLVTLLGSFLVGMPALFPKSTVPSMLVDGHFTGIANGLNSIGGILFMAAAARFFSTYRQDRQRYDAALFTGFCLLFGLAGVIFPFSRLWDVEWWIWHFLRLFAYSFVILYVSEVSLNAEKSLMESEGRFRTLFNQAAVGVAQIESSTGKFIRINKKYCEIVGFSLEETQNLSFQQITHPEDLQQDLDLMQDLLQGKIREFSMEKRYLKKDGSIVWVDLSVSPMWKAGDKSDYHIAVVRDITAMKQAEEELRLQSEIMNHMAEGVYLVRMDGTIVWANPKFEEMFGYNHGEILGMHVSVINFPTEKNPEETAREILEILAKEGVWQGEIKNIRKDGTPFWCYANVIAFDHSGYGKILVAVQIDIDKEKKFQDNQVRLRKRLEAQWKIVQLVEKDHKALSDRTLALLVSLSKSRYGFYGFLNPDETVMRIHAWSKEVMSTCDVHDKPIDFPIERSGIWANAIREKKILIINDMGEAHPFKKGVPDGHVAIHRIMVVPVFKDHRVVAVGAVANKADAYTKRDAKEIHEFLHSAQLLIDKREAEGALRRSERFLNEVGQIAKIGGWEMDLITRKAKWTQAVYDIVEMDNDVPIPGPDDHVDFYLPEFRPMIREAMRALIEDDIPLDFQARLRTAKGNIKWLRALGKAHFRDGACVRLSGTLQDITAGKFLEISIRESEKKLRTLVENIPGFVYRSQLNAPWRVEYVSEPALELTGYSAKDFVENQVIDFDDLILSEDLPKVNRIVEESVSNRRPYEVSYRIRHASGAVRWVFEKGRGSYDEDGNPLLLDGVVVDITDRKQAEMQVREYADRQAVLLREVNHRVKNNLAVIIGMLHKEEDLAKNKGKTSFLPLLHDLEGRIKGLLTVHSMFSATHWQPLFLSQLCERIINGIIKPYSTGIKVSISESEVRVDSDQAHHLSMVINELATNSLKYAISEPAQTCINVDISEEAGQVFLTFGDNGPGYPENITGGKYAGKSIGFDLMNGIVKKSLNGILLFRNENGAIAEIVFDTGMQ